MEFSAKYEVTDALQDNSVRQYFWHVLLRPRLIGFLLLFVALVIILSVDFPYKAWLTGFIAMGFLNPILMWVKSYFYMMAQGRAKLCVLDHARVEVLINHDCIECITASGSCRYAWDKINRIKKTPDFLILMHGNLPLLSLPTTAFPPEVQSFIQGKVA
ncbi:MAG: YcxB family protein [Puniceicoccales bacterium]|jgi:hypothetical protein|nr:YcxB family protein [Puniceicoccales bacterium]